MLLYIGPKAGLGGEYPFYPPSPSYAPDCNNGRSFAGFQIFMETLLYVENGRLNGFSPLLMSS